MARKSERVVRTDEGLVPALGMRVGPGPILAEELEARGLSVIAFASASGLDLAILEALISGAMPVNPAIAAVLARELGTSEAVWLNLERNFRSSGRDPI